MRVSERSVQGRSPGIVVGEGDEPYENGSTDTPIEGESGDSETSLWYKRHSRGTVGIIFGV